MTTPRYEGEVLAITGPEALSFAEMTAKVGAAIGRLLRFQPILGAEARSQHLAWGAPASLVEARLSIFRAIRGPSR
jgi:uncharacterized protein YbjT (DUF2867 family)